MKTVIKFPTLHYYRFFCCPKYKKTLNLWLDTINDIQKKCVNVITHDNYNISPFILNINGLVSVID